MLFFFRNLRRFCHSDMIYYHDLKMNTTDVTSGMKTELLSKVFYNQVQLRISALHCGWHKPLQALLFLG
jgi:hypothetical protein